jgi:hypothetical protein
MAGTLNVSNMICVIFSLKSSQTESVADFILSFTWTPTQPDTGAYHKNKDIQQHERKRGSTEQQFKASPVGFGVQWSFGKQHRVLLWSHTQLIVEGVVPDFLHVIPVGDNPMLDGILQREDTTFGLRLIADIRIFLAHANHDALVTGPSHNRWEDSSRGIITSETCLHHSRTIVADQGRHLPIVPTHDDSPA